MTDVQDSGKVATTLITNLKDQPITLALILFNLVFVGVIYFAGLDAREHNEKTMGLLIDQNAKAQEMLSRCNAVSPRIGN
jgi:hypothetical protein